MTQISIVIPATGSQPAFDQTLVQVLENRPPRCEIIVPHAADYLDPYDLGDEVNFVPTPGEDFLSLMNEGIRQSTGAIVHTLQSGVSVAENWTDAVVEQFQNRDEIVAIAPLLVDPNRPQRVLAAGVSYGSDGMGRIVSRGRPVKRYAAELKIDGPLLQAGFFRRTCFETVGLLRPQFGEALGSIDLAARLKFSSLQCLHVSAPRLTGWPLYEPRGFTASLNAERMYWQHRREFGPLPLTAHALGSCWDVMRHLPNPNALAAIAGRALGLVTASFQRGQPAAELDCSTPETIKFQSHPSRTAAEGNNAPINGRRHSA